MEDTNLYNKEEEMKKRITSMFLVLLMVLSLMPATVQASPAFSGSGSGTEADPYLIATAQELVEFRDEVNASTTSQHPSCVRN